MWDWLTALPPGAPQFLGSLVGAAAGLIAIVIGALFNAHLNRRRDDRLRRHTVRSTAIVLIAELEGLEKSLRANALTVAGATADFAGPDLSLSIKVFPKMLDNMGEFNVETIRSVIDCYVIIEQVSDTFMMMGGRMVPNLPNNRAVIMMPRNTGENVATIFRGLADNINVAVKNLNGYV